MPSEALPAGALLRRGGFRRVWMGRIEAACLAGCLKLPESGRLLKKFQMQKVERNEARIQCPPR